MRVGVIQAAMCRYQNKSIGRYLQGYNKLDSWAKIISSEATIPLDGLVDPWGYWEAEVSSVTKGSKENIGEGSACAGDLLERQYGFRPAHSTIDSTILVREAIPLGKCFAAKTLDVKNTFLSPDGSWIKGISAKLVVLGHLTWLIEVYFRRRFYRMKWMADRKSIWYLEELPKFPYLGSSVVERHIRWNAWPSPTREGNVILFCRQSCGIWRCE